MTDRKPQRDTFMLTEAGRKKLAALGIAITPDDERRAGWQTVEPEPSDILHPERSISAVTES